MKYAVADGLRCPASIEIGSGIHKLIGGNKNTQPHRQHGVLVSLLS
jgi:hypothetical protein